MGSLPASREHMHEVYQSIRYIFPGSAKAASGCTLHIKMHPYVYINRSRACSISPCFPGQLFFFLQSVDAEASYAVSAIRQPKQYRIDICQRSGVSARVRLRCYVCCASSDKSGCSGGIIGAQQTPTKIATQAVVVLSSHSCPTANAVPREGAAVLKCVPQ